jgi:uncharacterized membrane protein YhdT
MNTIRKNPTLVKVLAIVAWLLVGWVVFQLLFGSTPNPPNVPGLLACCSTPAIVFTVAYVLVKQEHTKTQNQLAKQKEEIAGGYGEFYGAEAAKNQSQSIPKDEQNQNPPKTQTTDDAYEDFYGKKPDDTPKKPTDDNAQK